MLNEKQRQQLAVNIHGTRIAEALTALVQVLDAKLDYKAPIARELAQANEALLAVQRTEKLLGNLPAIES